MNKIHPYECLKHIFAPPTLQCALVKIHIVHAVYIHCHIHILKDMILHPTLQCALVKYITYRSLNFCLLFAASFTIRCATFSCFIVLAPLHIEILSPPAIYTLMDM